MKKFLRLAALTAAALLLISFAAGCGGDNSSTPASQPASTPSSGSSEQEGSFRMPDKVLDYGGKTFTLAGISLTASGAFGFQEPGSSAEADLFIEWRQRIEHDYNCKLETVDINHNDTQVSLITKFMAGDKVADLITCQMVDIERIRMAGDYMTDLTQVSTVDLNCAGNLAYGKGLMDACTWNGKVYAVNPLGGFVQTGLLVNLDLLKTLNLEYDLWDLVDKKEFTLDVMKDVALKAKKDLTGEGQFTSKDQWGFYIGGSFITNVWHNAGNAVLTKNADGTCSYTASSAKSIDTINKIQSVLVDAGISISYQASDAIGWRMFKEGRLLFCPTSPYNANGEDAKNITFDMGLLPCPNMEAGQEYTSDGTEWMGTYFIPSLTEDKEFAGLILQSLNEDFWLKDFDLSLAEYENSAFVNHPRSVEVYRMLQKNIKFDLGFPSTFFGQPNYALVMGAVDASQPVGPALEAIEGEMQAYMTDVYNKALR